MPLDVSAPLPDLDWPEQSIITVDLDDAGGVITEMVVHLSQEVPDDAKVETLPPLLAYVPEHA